MPIYEIPEDDLIGEVLLPAMASSEEARIGAGFFTSHCLAQVAPGLAGFLRQGDAPLHLLISPAIDPADYEAMTRGVTSAEEVVREAATRLFEDAHLSDHALVHHTLDCLAYLIASNRLTVRFAIMRQGQYHKKQWLLRKGSDWVAVHGSGNATTRGLLVNGEQMTVDRPWADGRVANTRVQKLLAGWDRDWNNRGSHTLSIDLPEGLKLADLRRSGGTMPTIDDFWRAWHADHLRGLEPPLPPGVYTPQVRLLAIPHGIEWRTGRYGHQGVAIDKFIDNGSRGILAIATGGGKTQTALIAAVKEQDRHCGPLVLLILVPGTPLMRQWANTVRQFGVEPFLPSEVAGPQRRARLEEITAAISGESRYTAAVVCTQQLFATDPEIRNFVGDLPQHVLAILIGDEVHNLGAPGFLANRPDRFQVRIGLSATPHRQYDLEGSAELFDYFGPEVFEFSLYDAIRAGCLTPYNYYLHEVVLTEDEMGTYSDLTRQLQRKGFRRSDDGRDADLDTQVKHLLRRRRAVLEQAQAKTTALRELLVVQDLACISKTLIYASAKPPVVASTRQIDQVNAMLRQLDVRFHEFTSKETAERGSQRYLDAFGRGDYQVLTAMKVLDEGIDIPQTDTAYLLASSTVRREWIQRRGRILRQAPGKKIAHLHDFIAIPPELGSSDGRALLRGELDRAREFADVADNEYDDNGPRTVISKLERML